MRSGRLDRRIAIQRFSKTAGEDGFETESWANLGSDRRPASITPLRGDERFSDPQYVAREQVEFRVLYAASIQDITALDRIVYPSGDSPVAEGQIYDIMAVHEIGRREGFQIMAARRADVRS